MGTNGGMSPSNLRWNKGLRDKEIFSPKITLRDGVFYFMSLPESQLLNIHWVWSGHFESDLHSMQSFIEVDVIPDIKED